LNIEIIRGFEMVARDRIELPTPGFSVGKGNSDF
jgi:hypothetical protein